MPSAKRDGEVHCRFQLSPQELSALTFLLRGENDRVRKAALAECVAGRDSALVLLYGLQGTEHGAQRGSIHFDRAERVAHVFWKEVERKGESKANLMNQWTNN